MPHVIAAVQILSKVVTCLIFQISFIALKLSSYCSPPHTRRPGSYPPRLRKYSLGYTDSDLGVKDVLFKKKVKVNTILHDLC